ncbi:unnamed protein product, partial [Brassica rapa subsp. trilocularis]
TSSSRECGSCSPKTTKANQTLFSLLFPTSRLPFRHLHPSSLPSLSYKRNPKSEITSDKSRFKSKIIESGIRKDCCPNVELNLVLQIKRSAYAPEAGLRYDGVYRIEKCWLKVGVQCSFKVYCYLFVRCDNKPAPWTSDERGDPSRPLPKLEDAIDMFERNETLSWNFDVSSILAFRV